jgi:hypothetical protein
MKKRIDLLNFLGLCCIFSVFLDKAIRGVYAFDVYLNYPIFLLFLVVEVMKKGRIVLPPRWFITGCLVIFISSLFTLIINGMLGFEYWKQVFGILFSSIVYYNVLYVFGFNIKWVFDRYLTFAYWVALFGVVDNLLHIYGIHITNSIPIGPFLYREYSIMGEPFYLAVALTPAVAYYIAYFRRTWAREKFRFVIILICYLVTYSSIAVAGFGMSVFMSLYLNDYFNARKNRLLLAPFLVIPIFLLTNSLINNIKLINVRFVDTGNLFLSSELNTREAGKANSSTFALYSNYIIARDSFLNDPLFGSGLGSHPLIYNETFLKYFPSIYLDMFGAQNQQDANSKFLRLMSETGLLGLVLFFLAYIKFFAKKAKVTSEPLKEIAAINYAIFIYILLCLIRNGNYINVGFFLFMFIYYVSWKYVQSASRKTTKFAPSLRA